MARASDSMLVLVVGGPGRPRRDVALALEPAHRVREVEWSQLGRSSEHIDANALVLVIGSEEHLRVALQVLGSTQPSRSALVLVAVDLEEALLERALEHLSPQQVLVHPATASMVRYAVARSLPGQRPGRGAREDQRRAPALLGVSRAIRDVLAQVARVAASKIPVLILGETGTGKELVSRALHEQSDRAAGPFVAVNCAAVPDTLLESELFGFQRGAFTGAERDKPGLFEQASGGTLFLDEIGDMTPALQAKLLRALESGEIRRLGDARDRRVDARFVSATHHDLEREVKTGRFREDLYYRINTVTIHIPPLRRRRADIPFLAQHFAEEFGAENAREITLADDFLDALASQSFPGNVRELRNAVERAIALAATEAPITASALDQAKGRDAPAPAGPGTLRERVDRLEIAAIREALEQHDGNRTRCAEALGISRLGLRKKMARLGLE